jgi:hypothetical protein
MAFFFRPTDAPLTDYDADKSSPVPGAIASMRITEMTRASIMIGVDAKGGPLTLASSDQKVVPAAGLNGGQPLITRTQAVELYGRFQGKCMIHGGTGNFGTANWRDWTKPLEVEVKEHPARLFLMKLGSPNMALNAEKTPVPYTMDHPNPAKSIPPSTPVEDIIKMVVAAAGAQGLKHLVTSSHGGSGVIHLGYGVNDRNVDEFAKLKGKVKVIWIGACIVCMGEAGDKFVETMAEKAGCHVVAFEISTQRTGIPLGKGEMDVDLQWRPKVFTPKPKVKILLHDLPLLVDMEVVPKPRKPKP